MKINCEENIGTFIASRESLLEVMKSIMASGLDILQVSKCKEDGYHIFTEEIHSSENQKKVEVEP